MHANLSLSDQASVVIHMHIAKESAESIFGSGQHSHAYRHAYWSALLASEHGDDWANRFTTAHVRFPGNNPIDMAMDLHNNEVGRRIAAQHPGAGPAELERYVAEAVRNGEMVVVGHDRNLVRSNEIPIERGLGHDPAG